MSRLSAKVSWKPLFPSASLVTSTRWRAWLNHGGAGSGTTLPMGSVKYLLAGSNMSAPSDPGDPAQEGPRGGRGLGAQRLLGHLLPEVDGAADAGEAEILVGEDLEAQRDLGLDGVEVLVEE